MVGLVTGLDFVASDAAKELAVGTNRAKPKATTAYNERVIFILGFCIGGVLSSSGIHDSRVGSTVDAARYVSPCSIALTASSVVKTACARNA